MIKKFFRVGIIGVSIGVIAVVSGCGQGGDRQAITEVRQNTAPPAPAPAAPPAENKMSSSDRLGLNSQQMSPHGMMGGGAMGGGAMGGGAMGGAPAFNPASVEWTAPEGWERGPDRSMRLVTYTTADGAVECYVSILGGAAGGVEANINRWRQQMGQPGLSPEEIAALPKIPILGQEAPLATISGDYTGMTGEAKTAQTLLGIVCPLDDQTLFVKMLGPEAAMAAQVEPFKAFCASLKKAAE